MERKDISDSTKALQCVQKWIYWCRWECHAGNTSPGKKPEEGVLITFSVIIPTLNEEKLIGTCIRHVRQLDPDVEVIVADGKSDDKTGQVAANLGAIVTRSEQGRGYQCNAGASRASADVLLFLHVDTKLPPHSFTELRLFFQDDKVNVGVFRLALDVKHPLLNFYARCNRFDSVLTRFGDQAIAIRTSFFHAIGGFPNWILYEDVRLLQKARKRTRVYLFPGTAVTSARRFVENGIIRQCCRDLWYMLTYLVGVSPSRLAVKYDRTARR